MRIPFAGLTNNALTTLTQLWHPGVGCDGSGPAYKYPMPYSCTWAHLLARINAAPGDGKSRTMAIHRNGANTTLSAVFGPTDVQRSNLVDSASFAAGELVGLRTTSIGAPPNALGWPAVLCEPAVNGLQPFFGGGSGDDSILRYASLCGGCADTEVATQAVVPIPGKFIYLYGYVNNGPVAAGRSAGYTLRKNGVDTALALAYVEGNSSQSNVVQEVTFSPGDLVSFKISQGGGWHPALTHGICFIPDDPTLWWMCRPYNSDAMTSAVGVAEYSLPTLGDLNSGDHWAATESACLFPGGCRIAGIALSLTAAPGVGKSRTLTVRKNGIDTPLTVTVAGASTFGIARGIVETSDWDMISVKHIVSGGAPPATFGAFSLFGGGAPRASCIRVPRSIPAISINM